jgi:3-hexulose-6-phosphate synthase
MKLQVAFDMIDLNEALSLAESIHEYVDILEIGSLLLYQYGSDAIHQFRSRIPLKPILADMKIVDRGKEASKIGLLAGADWVTVLAGTSKAVIHSVCTTAHDMGKKVMLDLIDASSLGESALDAKALGIDALLFHKPTDDKDAQLSVLEQWDMVRGNTKLPIFISAPVTRETINSVIELRPEGIVLGHMITESNDPISDLIYLRGLAGLPESSSR